MRYDVPMSMSSLKGKLLLAAPAMDDPNFARAVVLIVKHDDDGALGLILNRPTGAMVRDVIELDGDVDIETDAALLRGGPCDGPLMVLHTVNELAQETVIPEKLDITGPTLGADPDEDPIITPGAGVYFTVESDMVRELLADEGATARYFHGYAGWTSGQLDAELDAGGWLIWEATAENVFEPGMNTDSWSALIKERGLEELRGQINPNLIPPDPTVN
jgi:putative transcriptional regulator